MAVKDVWEMTIVSSTEQKHGGIYMGENKSSLINWDFNIYCSSVFSGIFQTETIDFLLLISSGKVGICTGIRIKKGY